VLFRSINYSRTSHSRGGLSGIYVFEKDEDWKRIQEIKKNFIDIDPELNCAIGSFLGMVIGDALGAPFEFTHYIANPHQKQNDYFMTDGLTQVDLWTSGYNNAFRLKVGQWTDDASMGLCLADSLICCNGFDAIDLRRRFHLWWNYGYCNAFGKDNKRNDKGSVGLGGNISLSLREFEHFIGRGLPPEETKQGDAATSGNGSIMRNGGIPLYYKDDLENALLYASKQSKSTHQGIEAYECCRLLTFVVIKALKKPHAGAKFILEDLSDFKAEEKTTQASPDTQFVSIIQLARSMPSDNPDANWNWKDPNYRYSPTRAKQQPGYIGSYAMDALAMALHCVYYTESFEAALIKCANFRGDSDSVCAVVGQIAGAVYGWNRIPLAWVSTVLSWDNDDFILLRAYKLFHRRPRVNHNVIVNQESSIQNKQPPDESNQNPDQSNQFMN